MSDKEIVIVMGSNAAGKTSLVAEFTDVGYHRINRDELGGTTEQQAEHARDALSGKYDTVVLDNTYPTIESRESIIQVGKDLGVPVRCVWLTTSFEDASLNACMRILKHTDGKLLSTPEDIKAWTPAANPKDGVLAANLFPIHALFAYKNKFENKKKKEKHDGKQTPRKEHGFSKVEKRAFTRVWGDEYVNKAILWDADGVLRNSVGAEHWPEKKADVEVVSTRTAEIEQYKKDGFLQLGVSIQSACEKSDSHLTVELAAELLEHTSSELGVDIEWMFCPHHRFPVGCYCRKPQVGLGAYFIYKYKLLPSACTMIGDSTSDGTFAKRCGFQFIKVA